MSGTIVFSEDTDWAVTSGIFNWVVEYLASVVHDPVTKAELTLIEEQDFRWLDCRELSAVGRSQVLDALAQGLVSYAELHFPESVYRARSLVLMQKLADIAAATRG